MSDAKLIWDVECRIAESPVWDASAQTMLFRSQRDLAPGASGGQILRYIPANGKRKVYELPDRVGSFGLCISGRLVVALDRQVVLFDLATETIEVLTDELDEPAGNQFNDGKIGPDGCFWVGTSDARRLDGRTANGNGSLYRVAPDGSTERMAHGYLCSNGLAWSPDGTTMYQSDSFTGSVDAWDFERETGRITRQRRIATLAPEEGLPDGAACDIEGCYWSAGVTAGCLNRFSPAGALLEKVDVPCPAPTMPCFAGDVLYFTTLQRRTSPDPFPIDPAKVPFDVTGLFAMTAPAVGAPIGRFNDR